MTDILLSPISLKDFEMLIKDCVQSVLQNHVPVSQNETVYITRQEAAKILGISLPTLNDWSKREILPSYRIASRIRYKKAEVEAAVTKVQSIKYRRA